MPWEAIRGGARGGVAVAIVVAVLFIKKMTDATYCLGEKHLISRTANKLDARDGLQPSVIRTLGSYAAIGGNTMPDIFLSYARENRTRAKKLAGALKDCGWEVWWDEHIQAGDQFDRTIEQVLPRSTCVVVLWSPQSVDSDFVRSEARWAKQHDRLIPVFIDHVDLPIEFSAHQTLDLVGWPNDGSEGYDQLVSDLHQRIRKGVPTKPTVRKSRSTGFGFWLIGVAVLGLWPILASNLGGGDDPFIVAPMVIAGGLLVLSLLKPIAPKTALVFAIVPYILNLFAYFLSYDERVVGYHLTSAGVVVDIVALIGGLIVVYAVCKHRAPQ